MHGIEELKVNGWRRTAFVAAVLFGIGVMAFAAGLAFSTVGHAAPGAQGKQPKGDPRVVYPEKTELDYEGIHIEGEVRNPGEFYFQHRTEEKFDSLVKRRKNFHREMLRDAILSK